MPATVSASPASPPQPYAARFSSWPLLMAAGLAGAMLAGAGGLWAYFGTAVFFEMVRTGWIACF
jgi:hypothetical protein